MHIIEISHSFVKKTPLRFTSPYNKAARKGKGCVFAKKFVKYIEAGAKKTRYFALLYDVGWLLCVR
ncbi:hypothetical protein JCM15124A_11850 [Prevotella falsenii]